MPAPGSRYNRHFNTDFSSVAAQDPEATPIRPPDDALSNILRITQGLAPVAGMAIGGLAGGPVGAAAGNAIGQAVGGLAGYGEDERDKPFQQAEQDREAREQERAARMGLASRIVQGL